MLTNFSSSKSACLVVACWSLASECSERDPSLSPSDPSEPLLLSSSLVGLLVLPATIDGRLGSEMRSAVSPFSSRIVLNGQVG